MVERYYCARLSQLPFAITDDSRYILISWKPVAPIGGRLVDSRRARVVTAAQTESQLQRAVASSRRNTGVFFPKGRNRRATLFHKKVRLLSLILLSGVILPTCIGCFCGLSHRTPSKLQQPYFNSQHLQQRSVSWCSFNIADN